jgi:hypothetical protein
MPLDDELVKGLHARQIFDRAATRQPRIQYGNLKAILEKLPTLQVDDDGRGLILGYSPATEEITIVDRQLLLYRRFPRGCLSPSTLHLLATLLILSPLD